MTGSGLRGRRVVVGMYAVLVAVAGVLGALVPLVVEGVRSPSLFLLVDLPPTSAGYALYGAATVAVALGVPLVAVLLVSRRVEAVD